MASGSIDCPAHGERYLLVKAGQHRYAIPTHVVRRVVQMPDLYRVPGAHPRLIGLGQYGGEPLTVVDLEGLVGEPEVIVAGRHVVVVIAPGDELLIGLAADEAEQVTRLPGSGVAETRADGPISDIDADGVRRLDPSWFLDRTEDPSGGRDPATS